MPHIKGILPTGPYLPCVSMAGRALLAGYPRYMRRWMGSALVQLMACRLSRVKPRKLSLNIDKADPCSLHHRGSLDVMDVQLIGRKRILNVSTAALVLVIAKYVDIFGLNDTIYPMIHVFLLQSRIHKEREAIHHTDPINVAFRWHQQIPRHVKRPHESWNIDSNLKLVCCDFLYPWLHGWSQ